MSETIPKTEFEKMLERKAAEEERKQQEKACDEELDDRNGAAATQEKAPEQSNEQVAEYEQIKDQLLRVRADFDNYRKRMLREMEQVRQTASVNLIRALLPVLDNLERALVHAGEEDGFAAGVRMVHKQFMEVLVAEGLESIPAKGEVFDPAVHDALAAVPSESIAQGTVAEEYERGYKLRNLVLRPAKVIVSMGPEESKEDSSTTEDTTDEDAHPSLNTTKG